MALHYDATALGGLPKRDPASRIQLSHQNLPHTHELPAANESRYKLPIEATPQMASSFVPRTVFPYLDSLPRSYFLGHHASGLSKMKTMLSTIDLVIECRDYRVPLTSRNPLFEASLSGPERLIVYTKRDLGSMGGEQDGRVGGDFTYLRNNLLLLPA
jgi:hypothetical protein